MISKNIKILQWNLNGFYRKLDELKLLISEHNPEILCLQETNFNNLNTGTLKNYNEYRSDRTDCLRASGGVAIYIKSDLPSKIINITTHFEVEAASIKLKDMEFKICNIYLPNQHIFNKNDIENISYQIPKPFIMTGDFISHSTEWGRSIKTDNRGKEIEKMFENDNLVLLNNLELTL
jgi:exonuclease III